MFGPVHHVGITVADMDRAVAFWERLLARSSRDRRVLQGPQLGTMVGYPGIHIESWADLDQADRDVARGLIEQGVYRSEQR